MRRRIILRQKYYSTIKSNQQPFYVLTHAMSTAFMVQIYALSTDFKK
jgi:hypothetical protein